MARRPVVRTRVGGVPDLVQDGVTGRLVPSGDAPALADAVRALLADPARRRELGQAGRQAVVAPFGAGRLLADMDRLYAELLREKLGGKLSP
jgi:starch synthase